MRWLAWGLAGLAALLLLAVGIGWLLLGHIDLAALAASRATAALGRDVSIGSLHVTPGRWLRITLQDARVANLKGGTRPEMATLSDATAEVEAWPLLRGTLVLRNVKLDGLDVLLERVGDQVPNWRFHEQPPATNQQPHRDGSFPDLTSLVVNGTITVRTSEGKNLPIGLDRMAFKAPALDQPATLAGGATYLGIPLQLHATLGSIEQYRDAAKPFPATIDMLAEQHTHLRFQGTLIDPINIDGAHGQLLLEAPTPATLFRIAGVGTTIDPALKLQGPLEHAGNDWQFTQIQGAVAESTIYGGTLHLIEGDRASQTAPLAPDRLGIALNFENLDIDSLLARQKQPTSDGISLQVEPNPGTLVAAKIRAKALTYRHIKFADVALDAGQSPGKITVQTLSGAYLGGKLSTEGKLQTTSEGSRLTAALNATGLEVQALRTLLDMGRLPLAGRLDAHATLTADGATVHAAIPGARGALVLTMDGGSVSREIVELGSTDIRILFGTPHGTTAVSCVLGIMDLRGGVTTVSPLRLRTAEGTIAARGTIDVLRHRLDLTIASEARTTAATALDVPVHVTGTFADPSFTPAIFSSTGRTQVTARDDIAGLAPALQAAARASPCLGR